MRRQLAAEVTDEDRERWAREKADVEAWKAKLRAGLGTITEPVLRAVLDLHAEVERDYWPHKVCEVDVDSEYGAPEWPCPTTVAVAEALGEPPPRHWSGW